MNAGAVWWGQVGSSLRLLTKVTNDLRDCHSAVLRVPRKFPWRQDFYEAVDIRRSAFSVERRLMRLQWEEGADPGGFVLEELCSEKVRADYWPGQSYADYLGSREDILLNDYYVWVAGVHQKADVVKWAEFISQYEKTAGQMPSRAVYMIEYDGPEVELCDVEQISYTVENCDCRVFSLEAAAALENTDLRNYQAELALTMGRNDPERCYELLLTGTRLLQDPVRTAAEVIGASTGEQVIQSAAWEGSIIFLFPVLERYRMEFIARNRWELARHLPVVNSNGHQVTDPCDLEFGTLNSIVTAADNAFAGGDVEAVKLCRRVRNLLAHNKTVPLEDVRKILTLRKE